MQLQSSYVYHLQHATRFSHTTVRYRLPGHHLIEGGIRVSLFYSHSLSYFRNAASINSASARNSGTRFIHLGRAQKEEKNDSDLVDGKTFLVVSKLPLSSFANSIRALFGCALFARAIRLRAAARYVKLPTPPQRAVADHSGPHRVAPRGFGVRRSASARHPLSSAPLSRIAAASRRPSRNMQHRQ